MTIKQFSDDYVEAKGLKMIALARVTGEQTALLNMHYISSSTLSFLAVASQMTCLLIKHRALFRQFFGPTDDADASFLLDYWDMTDDWNTVSDHTIKSIKDRVINHLEGLYYAHR